MSDEDLMALNEQGGADTTPDTTPVAETETTEEVQEIQDSQTETTETSEGGKKGYSSRVQELANKAKAEKERADSLAQKLAELTGSVEPSYQPQVPQQALPPLVQEGEELTAQELNQRISERDQRLLQMAAAQTQLLTQQSRVVDKINKEARQSVKKYSQLNPESDSFNPKLSSAITKAVEAHVRANPTASVVKFVDELMEPYTESVQREVTDQAETVVKQAAQAALRPTNIKQTEKTAKDKSIAELEAELGIVQV